MPRARTRRIRMISRSWWRESPTTKSLSQISPHLPSGGISHSRVSSIISPISYPLSLPLTLLLTLLSISCLFVLLSLLIESCPALWVMLLHSSSVVFLLRLKLSSTIIWCLAYIGGSWTEVQRWLTGDWWSLAYFLAREIVHGMA